MDNDTTAANNAVPEAKKWFDERWINGVKEEYKGIFVDEWSPYVGAILVVMVTAGLIVSGSFWGVFGGVKNWGDWFNNLIGLGSFIGVKETLQSPFMHRISIMDMSLIIGAFASALLSYQFRVNRPPKLEYVSAIFGGTLMGLGASLSMGCNVGAFFTPTMFSSPAGWMMWAGLLIGSVLGLKLLLWTMENITWGTTCPATSSKASVLRPYFPLIGLFVVIAMLAWVFSWSASEDAKLVSRSIFVFAGFALGFIMHRSRFCFSRAFREPFMTGEGTYAKAVILALMLLIPITHVLVNKLEIDPYIAIPPAFWLGSFLGGLSFGIGMIFAGGCASGSLWRMGEGHIKLWVVVFVFAWTGSIFSALFKGFGLTVRDMNVDLLEETSLGIQAYLPDMFGSWAWAYLLGIGILALWFGFVRYNESTERFTLF